MLIINIIVMITIIFINSQCISYTLFLRTDRVTRNEITINGVRIPKGMTIGISIYALHRDPDVWPEPNKFDPERFVSVL